MGIGTSSPTAKAQIGDSTVVATNRLVFGKAQTSSETNLPAIGQQSFSGAGNDLALAATSSSGVVRFYTGPSTNSGEIGTGSNTERMRIDTVGNTYIETGLLWQYAPAPTSISAVTTLTAAQLQTDIINTTGTTYTVTLPTGTAIDAGFTGVPTTNIGFDFHIVNTASGTITLAVNTGVTSLGTLTVATGVSAHFRLRRTAANTYIVYRLS